MWARAEHLQRDVDLAEGHPAQPLGELLSRLEPELALSQALVLAAASALGVGEDEADADGYARGEGGCERRDNGAMTSLPPARWWTWRRASSRKPATYRCPFCGRHLAAMSEHMLIAPEGDTRRRRHAHGECVMAARKRGQLPSRDEWRRTQPRPPSLWSRLLRRV
jgi:hypothetical protein